MTVLWSPNSKNELKDFFKKEIERIIDKVIKFDEQSRGDIKKIAEGLWRLRVGKYRVYYHQEEGKTYVLSVVHRRNAYRENIVQALREEIGEL